MQNQNIKKIIKVVTFLYLKKKTNFLYLLNAKPSNIMRYFKMDNGQKVNKKIMKYCFLRLCNMLLIFVG